VSGFDKGRLNKRVTFQSKVWADNGQGGKTVTWQNLPTRPAVWAEIIGLSGDEALRAGIERNVSQWRVTILRRDDLTGECRMLHGGLIYDIKSVMPDPKADDATLLICEVGATVTGG